MRSAAFGGVDLDAESEPVGELHAGVEAGDPVERGTRAVQQIVESATRRLAEIVESNEADVAALAAGTEHEVEALIAEKRSQVAGLRFELMSRASDLAVRMESILDRLEAVELELDAMGGAISGLSRRSGEGEPVPDGGMKSGRRRRWWRVWSRRAA